MRLAAPLIIATAIGSPASATADGGAGAVYAFGLNHSGQLGVEVDSGTDNATPTPQPVSLPGATGPVTQIASGSNHSLVVTSTGQLYAFGENADGELGSTVNNGTPTANPTPTLVSLPSGAGPVSDAAAGANFSLVVTTTGQLYAFGANFYGQLGNATNNGTHNANPVPVLVGLPGATGPAAHVAAGGSHSLVATSSGQLYTFGLNKYGQIGVATNSGTNTANPAPAPVLLSGAVGPVTAVAAGS